MNTQNEVMFAAAKGIKTTPINVNQGFDEEKEHGAYCQGPRPKMNVNAKGQRCRESNMICRVDSEDHNEFRPF